MVVHHAGGGGKLSVLASPHSLPRDAAQAHATCRDSPDGSAAQSEGLAAAKRSRRLRIKRRVADHECPTAEHPSRVCDDGTPDAAAASMGASAGLPCNSTCAMNHAIGGGVGEAPAAADATPSPAVCSDSKPRSNIETGPSSKPPMNCVEAPLSAPRPSAHPRGEAQSSSDTETDSDDEKDLSALAVHVCAPTSASARVPPRKPSAPKTLQAQFPVPAMPTPGCAPSSADPAQLRGERAAPQRASAGVAGAALPARAPECERASLRSDDTHAPDAQIGSKEVKRGRPPEAQAKVVIQTPKGSSGCKRAAPAAAAPSVLGACGDDPSRRATAPAFASARGKGACSSRPQVVKHSRQSVSQKKASGDPAVLHAAIGGACAPGTSAPETSGKRMPSAAPAATEAKAALRATGDAARQAQPPPTQSQVSVMKRPAASASGSRSTCANPCKRQPPRPRPAAPADDVHHAAAPLGGKPGAGSCADPRAKAGPTPCSGAVNEAPLCDSARKNPCTVWTPLPAATCLQSYTSPEVTAQLPSVFTA